MAKVLNPIFDYLVEQVVMDVLEEEPLGVSFIAAHGAETKVEVINAANLGLDVAGTSQCWSEPAYTRP